MQLNAKTLMTLAVAATALIWTQEGWAETPAALGAAAPAGGTVQAAASGVQAAPAGAMAAPAAAVAPAAAAGSQAAAPADLPEGVTPQMMADGEKLFLKNCRQCHGTRGKAGVPLSGNENIADPSFIASMVINGRGYMPAFGEHLTDEQIALIGTFARNSWGNAYGPVTPEDVKNMR